MNSAYRDLYLNEIVKIAAGGQALKLAPDMVDLIKGFKRSRRASKLGIPGYEPQIARAIVAKRSAAGNVAKQVAAAQKAGIKPPSRLHQFHMQIAGENLEKARKRVQAMGKRREGILGWISSKKPKMEGINWSV